MLSYVNTGHHGRRAEYTLDFVKLEGGAQLGRKYEKATDKGTAGAKNWGGPPRES